MRAKTFCSCQKSSTACSRAGRSTWAGTWRYWGCALIGASSGGHLLRSPSGGTRALAPAVPPSLAVRAWPPPPHWGRAAGSTRPRASRPPRGLSSGGSGVIFTSRTPPGSHRPRVAAGCVRRYSSPSMPLAGPSVRARAGDGRPVFRTAAGGGRSGGGDRPGRRDPNGEAPRRRGAGGARRAQPGRGGPGGRAGRGRRAVRPVAACRVAIYRSRHDSRTRSHT